MDRLLEGGEILRGIKARYRYVVLFSAFLSLMVCSGMSYGVTASLTQAVADRFNESVSVSSWTSTAHIVTSLTLSK